MADSPRGPRLYVVVIADDDALVRDALGALIDDHPRLTLVASADNGTHAAVLCGRYRPDLAVIDVMMPGGGNEAVHAIREASPLTTIAIFTARSDRRTRDRLLASGARAVFTKGAETDLAGALHDLLAVAERRE